MTAEPTAPCDCNTGPDAFCAAGRLITPLGRSQSPWVEPCPCVCHAQPLATFLLARIAEEEAAAHDWQVEEAPSDCWDSGRVLDECAAKRRIVERCGQQASYLFESDEADDLAGGWSEAVYMAADVLTALAAVYADHPDYDETWRP